MGLKSIDHARAIDFALHPYDPQVTVYGPGIRSLSFLWPHAGGRKNRAGDQNRQNRRQKHSLHRHEIHPLIVKGWRIAITYDPCRTYRALPA
jgi:hypothetical protein